MAAAKKSAARKKKSASGKQLVIVESPAKAKTISKFLGEDFEVLASIGHVRDLPKARSDLKPSEQDHPHAKLGVDVDNDFAPLYCVPPGKRDQIKLLRQAMKNAPALWLATDEDREGEAISWHLLEVLNPKVPVHRLVFHEITRSAILDALANPREIDSALVQAQESRRILDRLYGYGISPVLWRKIRPKLSAGRVQSVALRLLVDREIERISFESSEYWDIDGVFGTTGAEKSTLEAKLRRVGEDRVAAGRDFDPDTGKLSKEGVVVLDEKSALALAERLRPLQAVVREVEEKPYQEKPAAPFTTSTLQQEAGRKLRFAARRTMSMAQQLYENGLITYMRTDSTALSEQAVQAARTVISKKYGAEFLPDGPRVYKTKVKNAQEAHEAIRPAGSSFAPIAVVKQKLGKDAARLYEMIWKRTVASQMVNSRGMRITVRLDVDDAMFTTSGKTIQFPGFRRAYVEGSDDPNAELADQERILPPLEKGEKLDVTSLDPKGHTTQPPARYTEASLVKMLDQRGIGRPSTWASIIQVLLDREYAFKKGTALVPSWTAFAVVRLLREHFGNLLDYGFTASMEDDLDSISRGEMDRVEYLRRFYSGNGDAGLTTLVEQGMEEVDPRKVCAFKLGETADGKTIEVRVGKFGLFLSDGENNASLREDTVPDELTLEQAVELIEAAARGPVALGDDPETKLPVYVKTGRFGPYVQLGDADQSDKKAPKPKMVSLLEGMEPETLDLATALRLLELPRDLGEHPEVQEGAEAKEHIFAHLGRYGPYVKWGKESRSIPGDVNILDIDLTRAVALLKEPRRRGGRQPAKPLRIVGKHPESGEELKILNGRFGPYVTDGTVNASLPKSIEPAELSVPEALELLARRLERMKAKKAAKRSTKKSKKKKAKKKAAKRKAAKKSAKKTAAAKKPASDADSNTGSDTGSDTE